MKKKLGLTIALVLVVMSLVAVNAVAAPVTTSANVSKQPSFNPDYSYVAKDLRRIGILAGSFVLILAVLSFFLR